MVSHEDEARESDTWTATSFWKEKQKNTNRRQIPAQRLDVQKREHRPSVINKSVWRRRSRVTVGEYVDT